MSLQNDVQAASSLPLHPEWGWREPRLGGTKAGTLSQSHPCVHRPTPQPHNLLRRKADSRPQDTPVDTIFICKIHMFPNYFKRTFRLR